MKIYLQLCESSIFLCLLNSDLFGVKNNQRLWVDQLSEMFPDSPKHQIEIVVQRYMQVLQCTYSFCYIYGHKNIGMQLILYTFYREEAGLQRGGLLKKLYFQTRSLLETGLRDGLLFFEGRVGQLPPKKKFPHNLTPKNYFQLRKKLPNLPHPFSKIMVIFLNRALTLTESKGK